MKFKWYCLLALLIPSALSSQAVGEEINVADHGVLPGEDATYPLLRLIQSVEGESNITLVFPKGTYRFAPDNALEQFRAVTNHDNSLKRMGFPLFGFQNITIDGGGSTFLYHGRISPIVIESCTGATLKNFSIDWDHPFHSELAVVENNEDDDTFTVEVDRDRYPYTIKHGEVLFERDGWSDPFGSNIVFDPKTQSPIYDTKKYGVNYSKPVKVTAVGKNRIRFNANGRALPPVGSVLITYGVNPTSRLCPAIHIANSSDIRVENVTVYAAGGMALIAERTENVTLERMVVTSTSDRLVATRADATHFVGCRGTVKLENCLFEHMLDDGINVHGAYVKIEEYLGNNRFIGAISHPQQWGLMFAAPGDRVAILSRETVLPFHQTSVEEVEVLNEERFVVTVLDVPDDLPAGPLSMENLTWYPDVVMKHNTIRQNRARAALITTKGKVLIDSNYFSSQMHGILIEGDNKKWYESGGVQDVTISNNVFDNIGFEGGAVYPLLASPLLTDEQRMGEGHFHRNIRFLNNTIRSFNGLVAQTRSVSGLTIAGNAVEFSSDYPANSEFPSIDLHYCDDVQIVDNTATGFDHALTIAQSADSTDVEIADNVGFQAESK
ncbi:alpha-1,3-galactosidase-related protein [Novipirellula rosea]|uniref:Right-handed parallel beta-helix repeat-containing protein n=1 Tax=Novipirellula rosea TaxID=1031540 RepID=A0ABP8NWX3_9BACT